MKRFHRAASAAVAGTFAMIAATASQAQPDSTKFGLPGGTIGHTYFNRPGATVAEHNADLETCRLIISGVASPTTGDGFGAVGGVMNGMLYKSAFDGNIENCMVVHGWRVVRLSKADGERIVRARRKGRVEFQAAWIGAAVPFGEVVRTWANEANDHGVYRCCGVQLSDWPSLSYALRPGFKPEPEVLDEIKLPKRKRSADAPRPLSPDQLASVPAEEAILIVRISGAYNGLGVGFRRAGSDMSRPAWADDQRPDDLYVQLPTQLLGGAFQPRDRTFAFAVPAGRWRLHRYGFAAPMALGFCLGAPAFELKAGDIVYAGSFEVSEGPLAPEMDLAPARTFLAAQPELGARIRPAAWTNGHRSACDTQFSYAFEIPGAPFEPDYRLASRAPTAEARPD